MNEYDKKLLSNNKAYSNLEFQKLGSKLWDSIVTGEQSDVQEKFVKEVTNSLVFIESMYPNIRGEVVDSKENGTPVKQIKICREEFLYNSVDWYDVLVATWENDDPNGVTFVVSAHLFRFENNPQIQYNGFGKVISATPLNFLAYLERIKETGDPLPITYDSTTDQDLAASPNWKIRLQRVAENNTEETQRWIPLLGDQSTILETQIYTLITENSNKSFIGDTINPWTIEETEFLKKLFIDLHKNGISFIWNGEVSDDYTPEIIQRSFELAGYPNAPLRILSDNFYITDRIGGTSLSDQGEKMKPGKMYYLQRI